VRAGEGTVTAEKGPLITVKAGEEASIGEEIRVSRVESAAPETVPEAPLTEAEEEAGIPSSAANELRQYGEWVSTPEYGYAWRPYVDDGWEPYYYGRWAWVSPYGWTWVGYEPWGWWPYHAAGGGRRPFSDGSGVPSIPSYPSISSSAGPCFSATMPVSSRRTCASSAEDGSSVGFPRGRARWCLDPILSLAVTLASRVGTGRSNAARLWSVAMEVGRWRGKDAAGVPGAR
jgi:hypothetical protein